MIQSKADLRDYLDTERAICLREMNGSLLRAWLSGSKYYHIWRYQKTLRLAEYHKNNGGMLHKLAYAWYHRKKHILGNRMSMEIPENTVGKGLTIYHIAPIFIGIHAKIGENFRISGNFIAGNLGEDTGFPVIGDNVWAGWNTSAIGEITIADDCVLGTGTVVTRSVTEPGSRIAGVPGKVLSVNKTAGK